MPEKFAESKHHAASGGFGAPPNATLAHRFASDASHAIDIRRLMRRVGAGDPGHFPGAGAHVRRWHIDRRADVILFDQLKREAAGDAFHCLFVVFPGVDHQAALGPAKRHIDQSTFVGHERRQGLHLVLADHRGKPYTAFGRQSMLTVHRPPPDKTFHLAVDFDGESNLVNIVDALDVITQFLRNIQSGEGEVKRQVDIFTKAFFLGLGGRHRFLQLQQEVP